MVTSASGARVGGLLASIRAALPGLVPSEQRVGRVCLDRPDQVVDGSVAELAAAAKVSTATVVRACQHLGFRGFQHLRISLARELGASAHHRTPSPLPSDSPEHIVEAVFQAGERMLASALGPLDRAQLGRAVRLLAAARRLLVVGNGGSASVAQEAALRFLAMGRPAEAPADAITQQVTARLMSRDDACLAITSSGANAYTLRTVEAARAAGVPVIGLAGYTAAPLAELADVMLVVGMSELPLGSDTIASRIASLLLLNALQIAVSFELNGDATGFHELLSDVIADSFARDRAAER